MQDEEKNKDRKEGEKGSEESCVKEKGVGGLEE